MFKHILGKVLRIFGADNNLEESILDITMMLGSNRWSNIIKFNLCLSLTVLPHVLRSRVFLL